jgi:hypothetical protein
MRQRGWMQKQACFREETSNDGREIDEIWLCHCCEAGF